MDSVWVSTRDCACAPRVRSASNAIEIDGTIYCAACRCRRASDPGQASGPQVESSDPALATTTTADAQAVAAEADTVVLNSSSDTLIHPIGPRASDADLRPPAAVARPGFCGECGTPASAGQRFCGRCGAPTAVESATAQVAPTPAAQPDRSPDQLMAAPGWYTDPYNPYAKRYWDGQTWTAYGAQNAMPTLNVGKSSGIAIVLTIIFPGLGHIYIGMSQKGMPYFIPNVVAFVIALLLWITIPIGVVIWVVTLILTITSISADTADINAGRVLPS